MPTQMPKNGLPDAIKSRAIVSTPDRRRECMVESKAPSPGSTALSALWTCLGSSVTNAPLAPDFVECFFHASEVAHAVVDNRDLHNSCWGELFGLAFPLFQNRCLG